VTAYRSIRIQMPDRPGALSAISTALAANTVDIVRLDVVSREGATVVDDLFLTASSQDEIGAAVGSFHGDVTVRTFDGQSGEPTIEMGAGLLEVATAPTLAAARLAAAEGARRLGRADLAVLLRATSDGGYEWDGGPGELPAIGDSEAFVGRWALQRRAAIAFPVADGWAPVRVQHALEAAWVAIAPFDAFGLLLVARKLNIAYFTGELERLSAFADAAAAILQCKGERSSHVALPAGREETLPARAITLAGRVAVN
jgi:hypothetical protein